MDFTAYRGEAIAMGERTPLALIDAPASGRMAVGEAITNIAAARDRRSGATSSCRPTGWRPPAIRAKTPRCTTRCARSAMELCPRSAYQHSGGQGFDVDEAPRGTTMAADKAVTAPLSLIVSAFAPVRTCALTLTPQLRTDAAIPMLLLIDLGGGPHRLGGSALAQVYGAARQRGAGRRRSGTLARVLQRGQRQPRGNYARLPRPFGWRPVRDACAK